MSDAIDACNRPGCAATPTVFAADLARILPGAVLHQFVAEELLMSAKVRVSHAADHAAYRLAFGTEHDPAVQFPIGAATVWEWFCARGGSTQTEIWMANRSDPELAAVVLPLRDAIFDQSKRAQAQRFLACGIDDRAQSDALLIHNIALPRGLALEFVFGTPEAALRPTADQMTNHLAAIRASSSATPISAAPAVKDR